MSRRYSAQASSNQTAARLSFVAAVAIMTLRYTEGDFMCRECGSTRLEYDEAPRVGSFRVLQFLRGCSFWFWFPRLGITRLFHSTGRGGENPQQDNKLCCLTCGTVHDCWDPLGLSSIDEVRGFRFRVFSSGGSGSSFSPVSRD